MTPIWSIFKVIIEQRLKIPENSGYASHGRIGRVWTGRQRVYVHAVESMKAMYYITSLSHTGVSQSCWIYSKAAYYITPLSHTGSLLDHHLHPSISSFCLIFVFQTHWYPFRRYYGNMLQVSYKCRFCWIPQCVLRFHSLQCLSQKPSISLLWLIFCVKFSSGIPPFPSVIACGIWEWSHYLTWSTVSCNLPNQMSIPCLLTTIFR